MSYRVALCNFIEFHKTITDFIKLCFRASKGAFIMRQINLSEVMPGMILGRSILNSNGKILLSNGTMLTRRYIHKLRVLNIHTLVIKDEKYEDIIIPEYLSIQTQQKALSVLTATMDRLSKEGTFSVNTVVDLASDIVEELVTHPDITIHLSGLATHDDDTLSHSLNCSIYTALLASFCNFSISQIKIIACGALLHDIGKLQIDKKIIKKAGRLTDEEFSIMKQHPVLGFKILTKKRLELSSLIAHMAWQHHEKIDGSGYPRGLKGKEILHYGRLLAITDVYEAVTANRPYRKAMSPEEAYNIIQAGLGTAFDEHFGRIFLSKIAFYFPGMKISLNTGEEAIIVSIPADSPQKPVIRLIAHTDGSPYLPYQDINLIEYPDLYILGAAPPEQMNDIES